MWKLIDAMSEGERNAAFDFGEDLTEKEAHWGRDKDVRDVLVHLYEWHQLLLKWVLANSNGDKQPFLPEPYNWKTYSDMNFGFWEKHRSTSYGEAERMLKNSHNDVMNMIEGFSNDELFENRHFDWTGTTSLGSYCVSATSGHYDWATKKVKKHIRSYRGPAI